MEILKKITFILLSCSLLFACKKDDASGCFTREGDIITEERLFDASFNTIELYHDAKVFVQQGNESKAVVKGGNKLIGSYKTRVEGHKLIIENLTTCKWTRNLQTPFEVYITMPEFDTLYYLGYGEFHLQNDFQTDTVWVETTDGLGDIYLHSSGKRLNLIQHSGAANLHVKGSYDFVYAYSRSMSIIDMKETVVPEAFYANFGVGDYHVAASEYFKAILDQSGNIYYTGDPEIYVESQLGSGQLIEY